MGILGFIVIPFLEVLFLQGVEKFFRSFGVSSCLMIVISFPICFPIVEGDLNALFAVWRLIPVYGILALGVHVVFVEHQFRWTASLPGQRAAPRLVRTAD